MRTSSPNARASTPSPTSAAATSPPAARARRWCPPSTPRCCTMRTKRAPCSISAASRTSPCCRRQGDVRGFDTGPANALMDAWCEQHHGTPFDAHGAFARKRPRRRRPARHACSPNPGSRCRRRRAPAANTSISTGSRTQVRGGEAPEDVQATLLELTARTRRRRAAHAPARHAPRARVRRRRAQPGVARAHRREPAGRARRITAAHGLDPDFVEAMAFAWLRARNPGRASRQSCRR